MPRERSQRWIWISAAVHVVALAVLFSLPKAPPRPQVQYIDLGESSGRQVDLPGAPGAPRRPAMPAPPLPRAAAAPAARVVVPTAAEAAAPAAVAVETPAFPVDTLAGEGRSALEPAYGDGRLWVRVSDVQAGNLPAKREAREMPNHVAKVDSALAAKIRTYLDTVPPDSFATRSAPNWTTQIAGQTWGIDGKWIYLGPIKIPSIVLAYLPLPQGNYDLAQRNFQLQQMREDLMQAAARAANAVEFRKYVKELRERKDLEHQQRIPPTPPPPPKDTLYP